MRYQRAFLIWKNSNFESESTGMDYSLEMDKNLNFEVKFHELACISRFCVNEIHSWRTCINLYELGRLIFRVQCIRLVLVQKAFCDRLLNAPLQQAIKVDNQVGVLLKLISKHQIQD